MEIGLVAMFVLTWVLMLVGGLLVLALMRVVGGLDERISHLTETSELPAAPVQLKGISISNELVLNSRTDERVVMGDLLVTPGTLLVLTDPRCSLCEERLDELVALPNFSPERVILAARGPAAMATAFAQELPEALRVIAEHSGLHLSEFKPPFAAVLDENGGYFGAFDLTESEELENAHSLLSIVEQRSLQRAAVVSQPEALASPEDGFPRAGLEVAASEGARIR